MEVITTGRVPIKIWATGLEAGALVQAQNLANLPFVFKHVAVMADGHQGYGVPIGGVLATKAVIIPNAIGVDIGCGVASVRTSAANVERSTLEKIMADIRAVVPVGFNKHTNPRGWSGFNYAPSLPIIQQELDNAAISLSTLGGGNHFLELQQDTTGLLNVMIHSGSRNFGLKIADYYHKKAVALCEQWCSNIPDKELSFLPIDTQEATDYLTAMGYALAFAQENRDQMLTQVCAVLSIHIPGIVFEPAINIHHNYAALETHYGQWVWVHRKGATAARAGQLGLIPGSQGTSSYVVRGLGNPESFMSCSHGAGRRMGRKQASRELDLATEQKLLDDQGIIHGIRTVEDLDEAAGAYKNIDEVMYNQRDLVEIVHKLRPLAVIKG